MAKPVSHSTPAKKPLEGPQKSAIAPESTGSAIGKSVDDLEQAIRELARPTRRSPSVGWASYVPLIASLLLNAATAVAIFVVYRQLSATRDDLRKLDAVAIQKSTLELQDAVKTLEAFPEKLADVGKREKLDWLATLPDTVKKTREEIEMNLIPALESQDGAKAKIDAAIAALQTTHKDEIPKLQTEVKKLNDLLEEASQKEAEAGARLATTVAKVRDMLMQIQYVARGDSRGVQVVLAPRKLPPALLESLLPPIGEWTRFKASHPNWTIEYGILVEGRYRELKAYGTSPTQPEPTGIDKFVLEGNRRILFVTEPDTQLPAQHPVKAIVDVVIVVDRKENPQNVFNGFAIWSDYCRKHGGESHLLLCEFEGQGADRRPAAPVQDAVRRTMFHAAAPRWPFASSDDEPASP